MKTLLSETVEKEVITIVTNYCEMLEIKMPAPINSDFVPGNFIQSHILLTAISEIAIKLDVEIPPACYIFFEKTEHKQLSIKETVKKILKVTTNEK